MSLLFYKTTRRISRGSLQNGPYFPEKVYRSQNVWFYLIKILKLSFSLENLRFLHFTSDWWEGFGVQIKNHIFKLKGNIVLIKLRKLMSYLSMSDTNQLHSKNNRRNRNSKENFQKIGWSYEQWCYEFSLRYVWTILRKIKYFVSFYSVLYRFLIT